MQKIKSKGFVKGIGLTLILAVFAQLLARLPFFSILGSLVLAILLGALWEFTVGKQASWDSGITFASKRLLRVGIILLGMRLNLIDIYQAGSNVFLIAVIHVSFALIVVYSLTRLFGVERKLGILAACGTAICGAAAVVAIAPYIRAKDSETAIGAAIVAILGTLFTLGYTVLYPVLGLTPLGYGVFAGGTLHEVAHVIAAADVGGTASVDMAIIVKLTRVALLVPVALIVGFFFRRKEASARSKKGLDLSTVPWFIFGFLAMSGVNTVGIFPEEMTLRVVDLAYLLIGMAMAGLGLNVDIYTFRKWGIKSFAAAFIGSILLSILGYMLIHFFQLQ